MISCLFDKKIISYEKKSKCFDFLSHTWATWHIQRDTPLEVLQELGGWSDYKMVQRYAHFSHQHLSMSNLYEVNFCIFNHNI